MKKLLVAFTLLFALSAQAGNPMQPTGGSIVYQALAQDITNTASNKNTVDASAIGTGTGGNVSIENKRPLPNAPGMGASSSNTTSLHRKLNQKTVSILLGGFTSVTMDLDIVSFVQSKPNAREELAACIDSAEFRKLRELENNACPAE
jgi:hypothetical protein